MKRMFYCMVSWMIFLAHFSIDAVFFFIIFLKMVWNSFWGNMIEYHNRVQTMCDDGKDVFRKKVNRANV